MDKPVKRFLRALVTTLMILGGLVVTVAAGSYWFHTQVSYANCHSMVAQAAAPGLCITALEFHVPAGIIALAGAVVMAAGLRRPDR